MADRQSAVERIRQLRAEEEKIIAEAKAELLEAAQLAVDELNELGFNYGLTEGGKKAKTGLKRQVSDAPCPICEYKTNPPHDGRKHRPQGEEKRPFNPAELEELELVRVA